MDIRERLEEIRRIEGPRGRATQIAIAFTQEEYDAISKLSEEFGLTKSKVAYEMLKDHLKSVM